MTYWVLARRSVGGQVDFVAYVKRARGVPLTQPWRDVTWPTSWAWDWDPFDAELWTDEAEARAAGLKFDCYVEELSADRIALRLANLPEAP